MKKMLGELLAGLTMLSVTIIFLSVVIYFVWNVVALWLVPSFGSMSMLVAFGLGVVFGLGSSVANYWTNKYLAIRKAKALESLRGIEVLLNGILTRIKFNENVLINKGLIDSEDVIKDNQTKTILFK